VKSKWNKFVRSGERRYDERVPDTSEHAQSSESRQFTTTNWSLVLAAGSATAPESRDALARLCERYWYPLYAYVRRHGYDRDESQDLTQSFFARLLETKIVSAADRDRGRFRCFLLASLRNFLANEWNRARAERRGGRVQVISLDADATERQYSHEPAHNLSPERLYDRRWALTLLDVVLADLRKDMIREGKEKFFQRVKGYLLGEDPEQTYEQLGSELGMSGGAVKVAVHRLRQRYGQLIRQHIAQTVACPQEVDEELKYLLQAVSG